MRYVGNDKTLARDSHPEPPSVILSNGESRGQNQDREKATPLRTKPSLIRGIQKRIKEQHPTVEPFDPPLVQVSLSLGLMEWRAFYCETMSIAAWHSAAFVDKVARSIDG